MIMVELLFVNSNTLKY